MYGYVYLNGRFLSVDPLAEKFAGWSAYHYSANNPINITDPSGMDWSETNIDLARRFGTFGEGVEPNLNEDDFPPADFTGSGYSDADGDFNRSGSTGAFHWTINGVSQGLVVPEVTVVGAKNKPLFDYGAMYLRICGLTPDDMKFESILEVYKASGTAMFNMAAFGSGIYGGVASGLAIKGASFGIKLYLAGDIGLATNSLHSSVLGRELSKNEVKINGINSGIGVFQDISTYSNGLRHFPNPGSISDLKDIFDAINSKNEKK